ncbi:MAG TPA: hypothetical protein VMV41_01605 [Cellulomonadaceae bacterium]|nr:hypothetical protein [Cellulomonadaceae bacterium]
MRVIVLATALLLLIAGVILGTVATPLSGWTLLALILITAGGVLMIRLRQTYDTRR